MVNFVETLFGLTAAAFVVAIVLRLSGKTAPARRVAVAALCLGAVAVILELYLQFFT
jgi:hypothetical protein